MYNIKQETAKVKESNHSKNKSPPKKQSKDMNIFTVAEN